MVVTHHQVAELFTGKMPRQTLGMINCEVKGIWQKLRNLAEMHKKKWDPIFEENNKKIATRKIKRGTRNADGSYTSADGTRTFKPGVHADANERYDELRASGQRNKAEEFGRKTHDAIGRCKNTGYTSLIDIGGKERSGSCPSGCCVARCPMSEVVGTCIKTKEIGSQSGSESQN